MEGGGLFVISIYYPFLGIVHVQYSVRLQCDWSQSGGLLDGQLLKEQ